MTRLIHLSDPHFGAAVPAIADTFLAQAKSLAPDFTILSGDLTMRARHHEMAAAKSFVNGLPVPRLLIPGNHDVPGLNQPLQRFVDPFRRYRQTFTPDLEPEQITEALHIVSLNSTRAFGLHRDWSEGILSKKQLDQMIARFQAGPRNLFRLLVLHHPLLAPPGHQREVVRPLPKLLQAIDLARIDLVLCGHFHQSHLATAGILDGWKCVVSQAATVCSTRLQGEPQGFHQIELTENRIEITPWQFAGDQFVAKPRSAFERLATGWQDSPFTHSEKVISA